MEEARKLAETIAANSPSAVRMSKKLRAGVEHRSYEDGLYLEAEAFAAVFESHDQREGMTAFVEKRKPEFEDLKG